MIFIIFPHNGLVLCYVSVTFDSPDILYSHYSIFNLQLLLIFLQLFF